MCYNIIMHKNTKNILDYAIFRQAQQIDIDNNEKKTSVKFLINDYWDHIIDFSDYNIFEDLEKIIIKHDYNIKDNFLGHFRISNGVIKTVFNVTLLPKQQGQRLNLSLNNEQVNPLKLKDLRFPKNTLKIIEKAIARPKGLILIVGPHGSGITTTLYSLINSIQNSNINISSIENDIEYDLPQINQMQVTSKNGGSIENSLYHLTRQNSDIIMVNDINSPVNAQAVIEYAYRGVPIFSSINAPDINSALTQFLQIGISPMQITSAIDLIISQKKTNKKRTFKVLKMKDRLKNLFGKPRMTAKQIKAGISEVVV